VTGFATGDVTVAGTAPGIKTATVTGSGTTYNVAVSGMTGSGTVIATIAAGRANDAAGNLNTASTSTDNTVTYSPTPPTAPPNTPPITPPTAPPNTPPPVPPTPIDVPVVLPRGIVNGASFSTDAIVSPGSIASLFGENLAATTAGAEWVSSIQISSTGTPTHRLSLPTALRDTQVLVNGTPAALFYVSPAQINFQMPPNVTGPTAEVVVVSEGFAGLPASVGVAPAAPGIFTTNQQGAGQGAILHVDYTPNSAQNPAEQGSIVSIYCTGLGSTNPEILSGEAAGVNPLNETVQKPTVLIGGVPAEVLYSGLAPGYVSLYQINARIPRGIAGTALPIQIQFGERSSNVATIAVR